jgi:protein-arginine kinase activator protein McsA
MTRREFPAKVRTAVIKRATRNDVAYCEKCGAMAKRFQIDHVRPDGLLGEPTIENAMLICEACYREKNPKDASVIAQAKRREAKHLGAVKPKGQIKSAPFPKTDKTPTIDKSALPKLEPRKLYA